jgi:hypothetical protein
VVLLLLVFLVLRHLESELARPLLPVLLLVQSL